MSDFEQKFAVKKSSFGSIYYQKATCFAFFVLFEKHVSEEENLQRVRFWIQKIERVRFEIENFTILNWKIVTFFNVHF